MNKLVSQKQSTDIICTKFCKLTLKIKFATDHAEKWNMKRVNSVTDSNIESGNLKNDVLEVYKFRSKKFIIKIYDLPYSSVLAPCDSWIFQKWKMQSKDT